MRAALWIVSASVLATALAGCETAQHVTPVAVNPGTPSIAPDDLIGRWGLASYHNDADRARTEKAAKEQCNKPYVISKGPTGGVMMVLADDPQAREVFVKASADGQTFIGPTGPPAIATDRQVVSFEKNVLVTRWVDPDADSRYGTMILVRCSRK
jgi:hypothetical protein